MIIDYTRKSYDVSSLNFIISFYKSLTDRGYILTQLRIELQTNQQREFLKLDEPQIKEFIAYARNYVSSVKFKGNTVAVLRNINTTVGNISNEFIPWNADFRIEISQTFEVNFKEAKKQDNLRQKGINIQVDRYKRLFLDYLNKYITDIRAIIRQRELTAVDLNLSRYVDPFYVVDDQGVDNSYVFP